MELIEALNKYCYSISLSKTTLYKELEEQKVLLSEEGFSFSIKTIQDLIDVAIIVRAIINKQQIDQCYNQFISDNYDAIEYINYDQRRTMFNHDLSSTITALPYFKDTNTGKDIYIPYLESFINQRYVEDYQVLRLKKHEEYVCQYPRTYENLRTLYGILPYISSLSPLAMIGKNEKETYLYFEQTRCFYIMDESGNILKEIAILDKNNDFKPTEVQLEELMKVFIQEEESAIITYMHEHGFIQDKTYKKISKKLG